MRWLCHDRYHWTSDAGYGICATGVAQDLRYSAWAPARDVRDHLRTHYAIGEVIPQRRALLGVFITYEQACAACAQHASPHLPG